MKSNSTNLKVVRIPSASAASEISIPIAANTLTFLRYISFCSCSVTTSSLSTFGMTRPSVAFAVLPADFAEPAPIAAAVIGTVSIGSSEAIFSAAARMRAASRFFPFAENSVAVSAASSITSEAAFEGSSAISPIVSAAVSISSAAASDASSAAYDTESTTLSKVSADSIAASSAVSPRSSASESPLEKISETASEAAVSTVSSAASAAFPNDSLKFS